MEFKCRVSDQKGKITQPVIKADNPDELQSLLNEKGLYLLSYEEKDGTLPRGAGFSRGRQGRAVLELTQALSLMIESGLTLKEAFEIAGTQFEKGPAARLTAQLNHRLRRGDSFSQALEAQGEIFPPLYLGMIRVGQKLGRLDRILPALADWMEKRKELRDRITGALIYPIMVLILLFAGITALLAFFLPYMGEMMSTADPSVRENLAQAYSSARGLLILLGGIAILAAPTMFLIRLAERKSDSFALARDSLLMKAPFLGKFLLTQEMLSLCFSLSVLTDCAVPLEESLLHAVRVLENQRLKKDLLSVQARLLKGESLSRLFLEHKSFPSQLGQWIGLGERTGRVDRVFTQLHKYYSKEMDKMLNRILTLAEPVVILLLGVVITVIIFRVILPLLTLYGGMS